MSSVDLIVAALAAGASAGVSNTATDAVHDAYTQLKDLLGHWFGDGEQAQRALQAEETTPGVWQARIGDALGKSGAAEDDQVLATARRLLELTGTPAPEKYRVDASQAKGLQVGDGNMQTNTFS